MSSSIHDSGVPREPQGLPPSEVWKKTKPSPAENKTKTPPVQMGKKQISKSPDENQKLSLEAIREARARSFEANRLPKNETEQNTYNTILAEEFKNRGINEGDPGVMSSGEVVFTNRRLIPKGPVAAKAEPKSNEEISKESKPVKAETSKLFSLGANLVRAARSFSIMDNPSNPSSLESSEQTVRGARRHTIANPSNPSAVDYDIGETRQPKGKSHEIEEQESPVKEVKAQEKPAKAPPMPTTEKPKKSAMKPLSNEEKTRLEENRNIARKILEESDLSPKSDDYLVAEDVNPTEKKSPFQASLDFIEQKKEPPVKEPTKTRVTFKETVSVKGEQEQPLNVSDRAVKGSPSIFRRSADNPSLQKRLGQDWKKAMDEQKPISPDKIVTKALNARDTRILEQIKKENPRAYNAFMEKANELAALGQLDWIKGLNAIKSKILDNWSDRELRADFGDFIFILLKIQNQ